MRHGEYHRVHHLGWLRAAVLGANDGIISTASLMMGMAAAKTSMESVLLAGFAGLVAGAISMAAGEYVSVCSQADAEAADLARERRELDAEPESERRELTEIYMARGLEKNLATQVAAQLMAQDALAAHARDELGIHDFTRARPLQAALASASSFSLGGMIPLLVAFTLILAAKNIILITAAVSLAVLAVLGCFAAKIGGANIFRGGLRVSLWGGLAMSTTGLVGHFFSVVI